MAKRYYYEERPKGRSKEEQAKINKQNWNDFHQGLLQTLRRVADWVKEREETNILIHQAFDSGEIAFSCEEISTLEFNADYTMAKYNDKEVKFRKNGFESEMLRILARAVSEKTKTVTEAQLIGSLERATGKDCIYKTVRNTRDRINKKLYGELGLASVIRMNDNKYELDERYLRPQKNKV